MPCLAWKYVPTAIFGGVSIFLLFFPHMQLTRFLTKSLQLLGISRYLSKSHYKIVDKTTGSVKLG